MLPKLTRNRLVRMARRFLRKKFQTGEDIADAKDIAGQGVYSIYFQLTESIGLKVYRGCYEDGLKKYRRQYSAYKLGFAPYCFGLFVIRGNGDYWVCHLTETILVATSIFDSTCSTLRQVEHIRRVLLKKMFFPFHDSHNGNWGVRSPRNKRALCLDFDM